MKNCYSLQIWSDSESADFWSLVMGWRITSDHKLGVQEIEDNLRYYFTGLMKPNHWAAQFPDPVIALKEDDQDTFEGSMDVFDGFHTGKQITLNLRATQTYDLKSKRFFILIRMSPKPIDHEIWQRLNTIKVAPKMLSPPDSHRD